MTFQRCNKSKGNKHGNNGSSAVAEEGKRKTYNRRNTHTHSNVDEGLERKHRRNTNTAQHTELIVSHADCRKNTDQNNGA